MVRNQKEPTDDSISRIKELDALISKETKALEQLKSSSSSLEQEIKALQNQIMDAGGVRLRGQKAKVDSIQDQITTINERYLMSNR